jgi:hypothetical protein
MDLLKSILAVIGGIVLIMKFLDLVLNLTQKLSNIKSNIWDYFAKRVKHKKLEKQAIKSNIETIVNMTVNSLADELPKGWINRVSIQWVRDKSASSIQNNEIILRIKPYESQDYNLINGIYFYFTQAIFPTTKEVIPSNIRKSVALQISKRTISINKPYLISKFEEEFLEKEIQEDTTILNYFDKYNKIDAQGFFTGIFIREVSAVAEMSRYTELRNKIEEEITCILDHIINFQNRLHKKEPSCWNRTGPASSYAFMLVAKPTHKSILPYLKRAKENIDNNIDHLYILGCNQEVKFVKDVINSISRTPEYDLIEIFTLHKDYRGENDGIGALLINKKTKNKNYA